jgi:hypothetical protein
MINPELQIGDRVVLLTMEGESDMSYGEKGEVIGITKVFGYKQYKVRWENNRTLDLLEDADKWIYEEDFDKMKKKKKIKEGFVITKKEFISSLNNV